MSAPGDGRLRRELHFWEAIALSIAIMAPTAAMALNGVGIAGLIGQAVPLAFLFATIGVLFVSYAFAQLTKEVSHAGSVYALTGFTLGARAGFLAGWALFGTYLCFTVASSAEVGLFFSSFLASTGIADSADWIWIALVSAALITLIVILVVVVFVRLIVGETPDGHSASLGDAFSLPSGTSFDAVATAAVFGFLSFAGFEGAAALGEETAEPRRNIPRAVFLAPLSMGIFYFFVMLSQTLGFGTNEAGVSAFAGSASPLGDLSKAYVGAALEDAINLGATISAFASALGTATAGTRVLYALSRDSLRPTHPLTRISTRSGAPVGALALVMAVGFAGLIAQRIAGTNAVNAFFYPGTIGVLALMVAYIATNIGAIRHLFFGAIRRPVWQIVFPVVGIAFLVFTIYKNVEGTAAPYSRFPWYVLAWLAIGAVIVLAAPHIARRIGERLTGELSEGPP